jgi:hypothetical protein
MNEQANDEISLKELIDKKRNGLLPYHNKIIDWPGIIGAVGLAYSFIKKNLFIPPTHLAWKVKSGGGLGGLRISSSFGFDLGGGGGSVFTGYNLNELFKSRSMVEQTLLTPMFIMVSLFLLRKCTYKMEERIGRINHNSLIFNLYRNQTWKFYQVHDGILGVIL